MKRRYRWCLSCDLVSVHPDDIVSQASEAARYLEHDNGFHQSGYVEMLTRLLDRTVVPRIPLGGSLLDYGCGYAPVLVELARRRGYDAAGWDPYFLSNPKALARRYHALIACEVVEHAAQPVALFEQVVSLLQPNGVFAVRSSLHPARWDAFLDFWYTWDRTHVSFYSERTVRYCADRFGFTVDHLQNPIWVLRRRAEGEA